MATRKTSVLRPLTERQKEFVNDVMEGGSAAGSVGRAASVKEALAEARSEMQDLTKLRRLDIVEGIMDGISMAKLAAEPATVIRGWVEIAKILGLDQQERTQRQLSTNAQTLQNQLMNMSTADLLEMAAANMPQPIEGEAKRVN